MSKKFLFGIGAQKSGSTWLRDYIQSNPRADLGFTKEYHIFDALWIKDHQICHEFLQNRINQVILPGANPTQDDYLLLKFLGDVDAYFSYFRNICNSQDISLTGDFTPSYAGLPIEGYQYVKDMAEKNGFDIKVVFIMRDPVDRCISANRMNIARKLSAGVLSVPEENDSLEGSYKRTGCQMRTRYDITINNIESVFDQKQIFYGFYETLFNHQSLLSLCNFLELPYQSPNFEKRLNSSSSYSEIKQELIREIRDFYSPVYDFIEKKISPCRCETYLEKFLI